MWSVGFQDSHLSGCLVQPPASSSHELFLVMYQLLYIGKEIFWLPLSFVDWDIQRLQEINLRWISVFIGCPPDYLLSLVYLWILTFIPKYSQIHQARSNGSCRYTWPVYMQACGNLVLILKVFLDLSSLCPLYQDLLFQFTTSNTVNLPRQFAPVNSFSLFRALKLKAAPSLVLNLYGFWGSRLPASQLYGKGFINWTISPSPSLSFNY